AIVAAEQRFSYVDEGLLNDHCIADLARLSPKRPQLADKFCDRFVNFCDRRLERNAGNRFAGGEREQHGLRGKLMKGRSRIEKILPVLSVCSGMYVDQQSSTQAGDPDRRR